MLALQPKTGDLFIAVFHPTEKQVSITQEGDAYRIGLGKLQFLVGPDFVRDVSSVRIGNNQSVPETGSKNPLNRIQR